MNVTLAELQIGDDVEGWTRAGFATDSGLVVGASRLTFAGSGDGRGLLGWALRGIPEGVTDVDGVRVLPTPPAPTESSVHPHGVVGIDHIVLMTPNLSRTRSALEGLGLDARRVRDAEMFGKPMRQVFYRLGEVILEVIGEPDGAGEAPASLWGITFTVDDIDATAAFLGDGLGRVKDAVQSGRRIATLRGDVYGISVPVAFLSPKR